MNNLIGLAKMRKLRDRKAAKIQADANAVNFGRTKADKKLQATRKDVARKVLDGHKAERE